MAYRYEKTGKDTQDLVIDGWENGIADSPFKGIGNIRNLNVKYYDGVAYVNYKRKPCTITGTTMGIPAYATQSPQGIIYISDQSGNIFKQSAVNSSTFAALTGNPNGVGQTGLQWFCNYLIAFGSQISICGDGTGDGGITSSNWDTTAGTSGVWPIINSNITTVSSITAGDTAAVLSSYTDAQGNSRAFWNGPTGTYIFSLGGSTGQVVIGNLTQGSTAISWAPAASSNVAALVVAGTITGQTTGPTHASLVSINDGVLYFCNGANVGSLEQITTNPFKKGNFTTFRFNASVLGLPTTEVSFSLAEIRNLLSIGTSFKLYPWDRFSSQWQNPIPMQEKIISQINILNNLYVFAGNKGNIYISNGFNAQRFKKLPDFIAGVIDPSWTWGGIMSHRQKLHFNALAINSQTGLNILDGIFSLDLDSGALNMEAQNSGGLSVISVGSFTFNGTLSTNATSGTLTGSWSGATGTYQITFSNGDKRNATFTNSSTSVTWTLGLTSNATASITVDAPLLGSSLLIDNNSIALNYDNYYSAWGSNGSSGIDFNDTTLWSSDEAIIETDIINIGTSAVQKTFSSAEYKLDQPLQSGDTISIYARQSLSDTYVQIGSTTTSSTVTPSGSTISNFFEKMNFEKWQWIQFKITMSCNSSGASSSFNRLREIRIR